MIPHLLFYQLAVLGLLWLFVMLHTAWPSRCATAQGTPATPIMLRRQRSKEPKPFAGLTHKPSCALCEHATASRPQAPCAPPPPIVSTRGRRRQVNTSRHFCPAPACRYCALSGRFAALATKVSRRSDERLSPSKLLLYKASQEFLALRVLSCRLGVLPERFAMGHKFATNLCRENGGTLWAFLGVKIP
jgi:hypothetical protein